MKKARFRITIYRICVFGFSAYYDEGSGQLLSARRLRLFCQRYRYLYGDQCTSRVHVTLSTDRHFHNVNNIALHSTLLHRIVCRLHIRVLDNIIVYVQ